MLRACCLAFCRFHVAQHGSAGFRPERVGEGAWAVVAHVSRGFPQLQLARIMWMCHIAPLLLRFGGTCTTSACEVSVGCSTEQSRHQGGTCL